MPHQQDEDRSEPISENLIYESSNGDLWYLGQDPATGSRAVKHVANPQSGGHVSYLEIDSFLSGGHGPEHRAFRHLMEAEGSATVLIAYDIHPARGAEYDALVEAIQSLGAWWHHLETVWIVRSSKTPEELRDQLKTYIGTDDQLLIVDITGDKAGWAGVSHAGSEWLKEKLGDRAGVLQH
jgi:hypothetical protein